MGNPQEGEASTADLFRYSPDGDNPESDFSHDDSDNEFEEASPKQSNMGRVEYTEMKEQMYQDKLAELRKQLTQLHDGWHPEWIKRMKRLEKSHRERLRLNASQMAFESEIAEREFVAEKIAAVRDFEDQQQFLREQLIGELEEKQKGVETDRFGLELVADSMDQKQVPTRKLRRRANEPAGSSGYTNGDKRRKPTQLSQIPYLLEDSDINDDLKIINKNKALAVSKCSLNSSSGGGISSSPPLPSYPNDIRIEDGKLFYEKRWFRRGQTIQVESRTGDKYPAIIHNIGSDAIIVKKPNESTKIRIFLVHLVKGKFSIKR